MNRYRRLFDFYINSSIHVSFAVLALTCISLLTLDITVNVALLFFIFFATVTGYNFVKYAKTAGLHHRSLARSLKEIQVFSIICGVSLLVSVSWLTIEVIAVCAFLGLLTLFYAVPLFTQQRNLRSISSIKILVIAIVWTGVTVVLPVVAASMRLTDDVWLLCIQRVFYVLAVMVPFEIRDLKYDAESLKTLPQIFGILKTKMIGIGFALIFLSLSYTMNTLSVSSMVITSLITLFIILSIVKSSITNHRYYSSFWVEGIPILWLFLELV